MKRKVSHAKTIKKVKAPKKRVLKAQRGKVSGVTVLAIAAVVLVLGGGAFFLSKNSTSSSPLSHIVKAPLNPNCELKDPELCKFVNNWQNLKDYSITSSSKDADGKATQSIFEVSGDNKSHMLVKYDGKDSMETITIDQTTYTKDYSDNKWWKYTYKPDQKDKSLEDAAIDKPDFSDKKVAEDKTTYKALGKEACGDLTCFKYQVIDPQASDETQYIWFDDKDYLLRKQAVTDKDGSTSEATFAYSGIHISEPSPVKEGTPEQMYAPKMTNEEKAQLEQMKQEAQQQMQNMPQGDSFNNNDTSTSDDSSDN